MSAKKIILTSMALASLAIISSIYAEETTSTGTLSDSGSVITTTTSSGETSTGSITSTGTIDTNTGTTSTGTTTSTGEVEANRIRIQANWAQFHEEYGFIKNYLLKPTSKEQAKQLNISLKADLKAYYEAVKALIKEGSDAIKAGTFDPVVFNSKAEEIFAANIETLLKYIDSAKVEDFKKFMEAKKATIEANKELRKENFQVRQEIKVERKRILTDKQVETINKKLEKKAGDFLNRLIQKIDVLIGKTKNEKLKSQLEDLKVITQEKLDSIGK